MMAIWNGARWYIIVVLICVPLLIRGSFCYVQLLESFYHKHLLNYINVFSTSIEVIIWFQSFTIHWYAAFEDCLYIWDKPPTWLRWSTLQGLGGFFCSYSAKDICLCSPMWYWSLTFLFCVISVLVSGWWWPCRISFLGFPSTLEFWKSFRSACVSGSLTGS